PPVPQPRLALEEFGLSEDDLDTKFSAVNYLDGGVYSLREILGGLQETYCEKIGFEFMHMQDVEARRWVQHRIEPNRSHPDFPRETKLRVLRKLYEAEIF